MVTQLTLIDTSAPEWLLDDETRAVGRRQIALARAALRETRRRRASGPHRGDTDVSFGWSRREAHR